MSLKTKHTIYLFITAMIWGAAFVAQAAGNVMGPVTFVSFRNFLAFLALLPVIRFLYGDFRMDKWTVLGGVCCGVILFFASTVQQMGLLYTSPGKAGFITACYMVIVPILGMMFGKRLSGKILIAIVIAVAGMYFICIPKGEGFSGVSKGDLLCLGCALLFACHILCVDHFMEHANGVKLSCLQFLVCGILAFFAMLPTEGIDLLSVGTGIVPLLYAGILSSGVGYTLQIVGQKGVNPSVAALILSLESCFAVLAGWILIGSKLSGREIAGCVIMFAAIVLTQLPDKN